jgi:hypothetical protein
MNSVAAATLYDAYRNVTTSEGRKRNSTGGALGRGRRQGKIGKSTVGIIVNAEDLSV